MYTEAISKADWQVDKLGRYTGRRLNLLTLLALLVTAVDTMIQPYTQRKYY